MFFLPVPFFLAQGVEIGVDCTWKQFDFSPVVSNGHVLLVGSNVNVPVKILRNLGAFDSFIVSYVLPFFQCTNTEEYIEENGFKCVAFFSA